LGRPHEFGYSLRQIVEEFNHYVLFADILEFLTGAPVGPSETVQLPAEKPSRHAPALRERRHPVDAAAVLFTEGGAHGSFAKARRFTAANLEHKIAHAMKVIYDDERDHFHEAALQASAAIHSDADLARITAAIVEVSSARVEMRREMFATQ